MFRFSLFAAILLLSGCTHFLFVPVKPFPVTPDNAGIMYQDEFIKTSDGVELHGWRLFADTSGDVAHAGSIIFFHGNGDNVSTQLPNTFWLVKHGYDLYVYDYRGYGQSQGVPDLDATIKDMELMIAHTIKQMDDDEKLIVMGHSLGGSMAIYTVAHSAHRDSIEALITVEAFSDYHDVTQDVLSKNWLTWAFQWPLSYTVDNTYRPLDSIGLISPIPVAIIHSKSDEMIDIYHAEKLFDAAKQPKSFLLINTNHNHIFISKDNRQVLFDYLKTLRK